MAEDKITVIKPSYLGEFQKEEKGLKFIKSHMKKWEKMSYERPVKYIGFVDVNL